MRLNLACHRWIAAVTLATGLGGCADATTASSTVDAATSTSGPDVQGADVQGQGPATQLPAGENLELSNNTKYFASARDVIQTAQKTLRIVQFNTGLGVADDIFVPAIINAKNRGVDVRVLLDDEVAYNKTILQKLTAAGVNAKIDGPKLRTHAKIVASEQGFVIGSTNWSSTSINKNNETNVLVRDAAAITQLLTWIDKLWSNPAVNVPMGAAKSSAVPLYADGGYYDMTAPLVDAAKTRILLCTYGMNVDPKDTSSKVTMLVNKLGKAVKRGVKVQVLLDTSPDAIDIGNDINNSAAVYLKSLGCDVKSDPETVITHAKFIVTDNVAVLGSNNWGYGGFQSYHEVGVRVLGAKPVQGLVDYFGKIWNDPKSSPM